MGDWSARSWRRRNPLRCDDFRQSDGNRAPFGFDDALCLSARDQHTERISEAAIDSGAHDDTRSEAYLAEKVDSIVGHELDPIPLLLQQLAGLTHIFHEGRDLVSHRRNLFMCN